MAASSNRRPPAPRPARADGGAVNRNTGRRTPGGSGSTFGSLNYDVPRMVARPTSGTTFRDAVTGGGARPAVRPYVGPYRDGAPERTGLDTETVPYWTAYGEMGRALGGAPTATAGGFPASGGGGGGGRGGGAAGPSAEEVAAYTALYNSMQPDTSQFDVYDESMRRAYDNAPVNQRFDLAAQGVQGASQAGQARLAPIQQELAARAAQARTDVSGAYSQGDARLRALQNEYMAASQAAAGGLNNVLGAFDAGSIAPSGQQNLQNLFANSRVANEGYRTVSDAGLADRPAVYAGLNADVLQGITRDQAGLESKLAAERLAAITQNDQALQQALAQSGVERMQYTTQAQQDALKLKAELAAMGIIV